METELLSGNPAGVETAARLLRAGHLVAMPTETVYGLAGDATDDRAVASIFAAKGRPQFNPLIVHVEDTGRARALGAFDPLSLRLAAAFWPGPLTLVVPRVAGCPVSLLVSAGLDTLALRVPDHELARAVIGAAGRPLAAPSANPSGRISPTRADHVLEGLGGRIAAILDGGPARVGLESTVVRVVEGRAQLLRPGGLTRAALEAVAGPVIEAGARPEAPHSPGQLEGHYAPRRPLRLGARAVGADEALLAFGPCPPAGARRTLNLSPAGDPIEAAANLFAMMRALDHDDVRAIAVMAIPDAGLGEAINDRLARAARGSSSP